LRAGTIIPLDGLQQLLPALLHCKLPAGVDSVVVAGLLDLLRTAGVWRDSVRLGYVYGALAACHSLVGKVGELWGPDVLGVVTALFEREWAAAMAAPEAKSLDALRNGFIMAVRPKLHELATPTAVPLPRGVVRNRALDALASVAVDAFFDNGLLAAARQLLAGARGSFGLVLSHSLDCESELVVAARGQTMSVAFYPAAGLVLFGSESAATKAAMGMKKASQVLGGGGGGGPRRSRVQMASPRVTPQERPADVHAAAAAEEEQQSLRLDLDDVNGEVVLLRWGAPAAIAQHADSAADVRVMSFGGDDAPLFVRSFIDGRNAMRVPLMGRMLRLDGNTLVQTLPPLGIADAVGSDIADIPRVLGLIKADWANPSESQNRMSAYTLGRQLRKRMLMHDTGTHDGSVDLMITGCEVSLWLGEQFASDLLLAFPKLRVEVVSANKLLGQLGQGFPTPQVGFRLNQRSLELNRSCVLMISHSGGTFGTLNCANLLKGFTDDLFVVTSEWDTQIARAVRAGKPGAAPRIKLASYVFSTFTGLRPAEPCSLTVAATHALLTQILIYVMHSTRLYMPEHPAICGSQYDIEEVRELEDLDRSSTKSVGAIVDAKSAVNGALCQQGALWAQHVLEGPISQIMIALYIAVTVTLGWTPLSAIAHGVTKVLETDTAAATDDVFGRAWWAYPVGFADAVIYFFLPWWTTVLLRKLQGRPWLHRVAGRSLLIGDIPWVSQSLEAYVSKLFALSYSVAGLTVASGNPCDHLVHRHTHRVVRGALLAVGRPDGRLNGLSSAEATCCLSVNQASSIQNWGVTCESFTLGHNPVKLGLSAAAVFLPRTRKLFLCEHILEKMNFAGTKQSTAASSVMADLVALNGKDSDEDNDGTNDVFDDATIDGGAAKHTSRGGAHFTVGRTASSEVEPIAENYLGSWMASDERYRGLPTDALLAKQALVQSLYEGRCASLERFIAFAVLFHHMARKVQDFWRMPLWLGQLRYDMSRTQSIMRVATTASPVSGMEVRDKTLELMETTMHTRAISMLQLLAAKWLVARGGVGSMSAERIDMMRLVLLRRSTEPPPASKGNRDWSSLLCSAAHAGAVSELSALIAKGAPINVGDYDRRTAMHLAASEGLLDVVKYLVEEAKADPSPQDRWGNTPLDDATRCGYPKVAEYLGSRGATVSQEVYQGRDWSTLLCTAASKGSVDELSALIAKGAPINVGDYDKRTALHLAASEGLLDVVKYLVDEAKADPSPQDRWGNTPLNDAQRSSHSAVAKFLASRGATGSKEAFNWSTLLCTAASKGSVDELSALIAKGAPINVGDYDKRTAIHLAASEGLLDVVKYLVDEAKADTSPQDRWGNTPLDDAIRSSHFAVADYLSSRGAAKTVTKQVKEGGGSAPEPLGEPNA